MEKKSDSESGDNEVLKKELKSKSVDLEGIVNLESKDFPSVTIVLMQIKTQNLEESILTITITGYGTNKKQVTSFVRRA